MPRRPGRPRKRSLGKIKQKFSFKSESSKEVFALILFVLGIVFLLSLLGWAGGFGQWLA